MDGSVGVHNQLDHQRKPILALVERRPTYRKCFREHGIAGNASENRGGIAGGVLVQRRALRNPHIHVGDGYAQPGRPIGQYLGNRNLIQLT